MLFWRAATTHAVLSLMTDLQPQYLDMKFVCAGTLYPKDRSSNPSYGVAVLLHQPASHPIFLIWVG